MCRYLEYPQYVSSSIEYSKIYYGRTILYCAYLALAIVINISTITITPDITIAINDDVSPLLLTKVDSANLLSC